MKIIYLSIIPTLILNSCENDVHIDRKEVLPLWLKQSIDINNNRPSQKELEKKLQEYKKQDEISLDFTYVNQVDRQYVITDMGYPSSSKYNYDYFIKQKGSYLIIDKIIAETATYAMFDNFIIDNININLTANFVDIGNNISSRITNKYRNEQFGSAHDLPTQRPMGKIKDVVFLTRYNNIDELLNFKPNYIIQCNDRKLTLKKDTIFFIGYNYNNLNQEKFAVIKDSSNKYTYYYDMEKLCLSNSIFRKE